ncbi:MAG: dTDP-4-dehydrorhamnose 3,5-epimerase [Candidatus Moranbacteria bacterium]|nr:dTDP-4-dehydrorhamnose 3,5-epimerase [Candidatus Moranbacteria bacterium]
MIEGLKVKKLQKFRDNRGWLMETFRNDELPKGIKPVMSYVSMTKPGVVRGPHEHVHQADIFVFMGPGNFELHLWDNRKNSKTYKEYLKIKVGEANPAQVVVPKGVVHGYKNISKKEAWCLNYPDKLYAGKNKEEKVDEIRHEADENSPFIIK